MKTKVNQKKSQPVTRTNSTENTGKTPGLLHENTVQQHQSNVIQNSPMLIMQQKKLDNMFGAALQREMKPEDEKLLQGKMVTQREAKPEDEELLQGKMVTQREAKPEEEELLQGKMVAQRESKPDEEELLQGKFMSNPTLQMQPEEDEELPVQGKMAQLQKQENKTGMPDNLKAGVEQLSGLDMSDVRVHYNSSKPASVQAHAYTQGTDIHVAPGQEQHLGHEAWHVAQQKQGRVQPTIEIAGIPVNDNPGLESEADVMGGKASRL
jgi:hypothetical protein